MTDSDGSTRAQYELLSSTQLHDLAVRRARHHLDLHFFWQLMEVLPAAQAASGDLREAEADVAQMSAHLNDITDAGRGEVAEALRPFYIDYLTRKDDAADAAEFSAPPS
jgi:hypothetical protein